MDDLETERMKLVACGTAALANTRSSAKAARIKPDNPYYTQTYEDVCNAVDREIMAREKSDKCIHLNIVLLIVIAWLIGAVIVLY